MVKDFKKQQESKYQCSLRAITMKTLHYKVLLRKEEDGTYTVIVPSLPGCLTFGRTVEEALAMAKEAIEGFIACMIESGEEVQVETDDSMICTVAVEDRSGLMHAIQRTLAPLIEKEADIYSVADLKIRFR